MFHPSGHSSDEARIEMSGHILSTEARDGEPGSSGRQLDFKPQALIQSHFCLSPSSFLFCLSLHHPTSPHHSPVFWASPELSNISTWFSSVSTSFPAADRVSLPGPQRDRIRCRPHKVIELSSIRWNPKPSICFFLSLILSSTSAKALHLLLSQCHTIIRTFHKSHTFPLLDCYWRRHLSAILLRAC